MPYDKSRHTEDEFARALHERKGERGLRGHTECCAQYDETAFLHAERARHGKGGTAQGS